MAEFEFVFREALRQIGAEALGIFLSKLQQTPESEIACDCDGRLHYQRMRTAMMMTVFGKLEYKRAYYAGCSCGQCTAPVDKTYGLEAGAISSELAQLMALAGIAFSFIREAIVTLQEGPFRGYEGIFDASLSGDERVQILLKLLSRRQILLGLPIRQLQHEM